MIKSKLIKSVGIMVVLILTLSGCSSAPKKQSQSSTQIPGKNINSYYFTANEGGSITKIDSATNKVLETINDKGKPHNVQVSPDGKIVAYTSVVMDKKGMSMSQGGAMGTNGSAFFYNIDTGKLIKKVEVGKHPAHIVFTQDSKYVLVTNNQDNNVSVIDAKTYKLVNNISIGKGPHGFRISKDSRFAYVANMGEDTVSVVDIKNNKELRKIKVGKTPSTTAVTSDGKTLIATINAENSLAVVDLSTDKVEKIAVGVGPAQTYIEPDDKYAFVANQGTEESPSNTVSKIDLTTKKVVATIKTGKGAHGVVTSIDNKIVYVTNMYDNTVSVIDNKTNKVTATVKVGKTPNGISYR
ncbi:YncE family protein [Clostridium algoriphilum]|uniref:YncE family protein n=1 Tax=Clostridium algoriphilum TaxID=198347 RepID=UPI001CF2AE8E|nr:YncE family protein [Clostridium algoriphilum]MCB2296079.1 YncE family protein [Clostridium algoriphilum]